jgi:hypothetical protein
MVTRNVSYMETISKMYFADAANHDFPVNGRAPVGLTQPGAIHRQMQRMQSVSP